MPRGQGPACSESLGFFCIIRTQRLQTPAASTGGFAAAPDHVSAGTGRDQDGTGLGWGWDGAHGAARRVSGTQAAPRGAEPRLQPPEQSRAAPHPGRAAGATAPGSAGVSPGDFCGTPDSSACLLLDYCSDGKTAAKPRRRAAARGRGHEHPAWPRPSPSALRGVSPGCPLDVPCCPQGWEQPGHHQPSPVTPNQALSCAGGTPTAPPVPPHGQGQGAGGCSACTSLDGRTGLWVARVCPTRVAGGGVVQLLPTQGGAGGWGSAGCPLVL